MVVLVLIKIFFLISPVTMPVAGNEAAFAPLTILIVAVMGLLGLLLARRTGFPEIWDERISNRQRFLIPCVIGLVYGLATVGPLMLGISNRVHPLAVSSDVHVKFPLSIPYYTYGALFLEILLRLFACR